MGDTRRGDAGLRWGRERSDALCDHGRGSSSGLSRGVCSSDDDAAISGRNSGGGGRLSVRVRVRSRVGAGAGLSAVAGRGELVGSQDSVNVFTATCSNDMLDIFLIYQFIENYNAQDNLVIFGCSTYTYPQANQGSAYRTYHRRP